MSIPKCKYNIIQILYKTKMILGTLELHVSIPKNIEKHTHTHTHTHIYIYIYIYIYKSSLSLHVNSLTFRWNEFLKAPYAFQVLLAPTGAISVGANNEMTNTITSHILLYKEKEEQVAGEFTEENNFARGKWKNWREMCYRHFKMLHSKLLLFKEGIYIHI